MKTSPLFGLLFLLLVALLCAVFAFTGRDDFALAKREIALREIGHQLLLQSGDSTSRVLPVTKVTENEYRVSFGSPLTFQPDALVRTVRRALAKDGVAENYIVNVLNCPGTEVVFGFAILGSKKDDIVPCRGREQPKNCYILSLRFQPTGITATQKKCLLGGLPLLALMGLMVSRSVRPKKNTVIRQEEESSQHFQLGALLFEPGKRQLSSESSVTRLTAKETRLLVIFARSPNSIIERARLQKEIWEDEGVIVGRSLDVFISKLRKKLEPDPQIQLVNVHGKGYKLMV